MLLSLHREEGRPDPRGGHHRGRLAGVVDRRRHALRHPRRADGAVLHLLLDVRLPAGRRPHLAGRRRPRPRVPAAAPPPGARRCSARASSTRTATARCSPRPCRCARPTTPPSPTRRRRSSGAASTGCTAPSRRGRLLLPHPLQREPTSMPARPDGVTDDDIDRGLYRWAPAPAGDQPGLRATILFSGSAQGAARAAAAELAEKHGVGVRAVVGHVVQAPAGGGPRRASAGTACTPTPSRGCRVVTQLSSATAPVRSSPSPTTCGRCPTRSAAGSPTPLDVARHRRRSAAATPARRCAASSRSTPATSSSPSWPRWPRPATSTPRSVLKAAADHGIDRDVEPSWTRSSHRASAPTSRSRPALVSVVVPVLNEATDLPGQLAALRDQTYRGPWELLICDNGSVDGTQDVARSWQPHFHALRVIDASESERVQPRPQRRRRERHRRARGVPRRRRRGQPGMARSVGRCVAHCRHRRRTARRPRRERRQRCATTCS